MLYLVTGGCGFIGSNIVDKLVSEGKDALVVDDLSTGKEENLNKKASFFNEPIREFVKREVPVDYIIHTAALPRVPRSVKEPVVTHEANVTETLRLLEYANRVGVKRFVYSSSSSVYGKHRSPEMYEDMSKKPLSPYALQKYMGEEYCELWRELFDLETVILRYFNVWGPRQLTEGAYCLVLGKFLSAWENEEDLTVYGDGKQTRAFTHVSDVARANLLALEYDDSEHHVFNIGVNKETSVNEIAQYVGGDIEYIVPNPRGEFEERRKFANVERAEKYLGWKPTIFLDKDFRKHL